MKPLSHSESQDALDAFIEGRLDKRARERLLEHLKGCAPCREDAEGWKRVLSEAAALPRSIEPPAHLWWRIADALQTPAPPEIRPATRPREGTRFRYVLAVLATAAVFAVAIRVAPRPPASKETTLTFTEAPELFVISGTGKSQPSEWARMIWALEEESLSTEKAVFSSLSGHLDDEALARASAVEPGLKALDIAIGETAKAMQLDPENRQLARTLTGYYERKLELLRVAARLASGTWA